MAPSTPAPEPTTTPTEPRRSRRGLIIGALVVLAAVVAVVLVVFQPQKLFIDNEVNEALPGLATGPAPTTTPPSTAAGTPTAPPTTTPTDPLAAAAADAARRGVPVAVSTGSFTSKAHPTSGEALIVVQPDGSRLVRLQGLDTDNGPDLRLVLSAGAPGSGSYDDRIELAELKGNKGDQNYQVPADVDLTRYRTVVIWCERFTVAFGEAPIDLPAATASSDGATTAATPSGDGPVITVVSTPYGPALGTGAGPVAGKVLYAWDREADGTIQCTGECATKWPPLTATAVTTAPGIDPGRFTLVSRPDGGTQVALDGRPLYTMAIDRPGEASCQGGDGWWIRTPDGAENTSLTPV